MHFLPPQLVEKRKGELLWRYEWDPKGRLAAVETPDGSIVQFAYDAFERRLKKTVLRRGDDEGLERVHETRFVWDDDQIIHEIRTAASAAGDPVVEERTYSYEDEADWVPLAHQDVVRVGDGSTSRGWVHYFNDPTGTPETLIDDTGTVVCEIERSAWGKRTISSSTGVTTPLAFQGQYADDETGLHYNRHRYYDPEIGRFISPDPIGVEGGIHAYQYVISPFEWVDPFGLTPSPKMKLGDSLETARKRELRRVWIDRGGLKSRNSWWLQELTWEA